MKKQFKKTKSSRPVMSTAESSLGVICHTSDVRCSRALGARAGFTLIEIVIAMAITTMMGIFFVRLARDTTDSTLRFNSQLLAQQQIEQTLALLVPEIRSISQGIDGSYPIAQATTSTFQFYADVDRDGNFDKVRYFLSGNELQKGIIKPTGSPLSYPTSGEATTTLVQGIVPGAQIFTYYGSGATSSASTALPSPVDVLSIKTVKVTLVVDQGLPGKPSFAGAETSATIRNLRYK
jgi:prepilin-type N-terminal cleavage/methylation domain-containing protein